MAQTLPSTPGGEEPQQSKKSKYSFKVRGNESKDSGDNDIRDRIEIGGEDIAYQINNETNKEGSANVSPRREPGSAIPFDAPMSEDSAREVADLLNFDRETDRRQDPSRDTQEFNLDEINPPKMSVARASELVIQSIQDPGSVDVGELHIANKAIEAELEKQEQFARDIKYVVTATQILADARNGFITMSPEKQLNVSQRLEVTRRKLKDRFSGRITKPIPNANEMPEEISSDEAINRLFEAISSPEVALNTEEIELNHDVENAFASRQVAPEYETGPRGTLIRRISPGEDLIDLLYDLKAQEEYESDTTIRVRMSDVVQELKEQLKQRKDIFGKLSVAEADAIKDPNHERHDWYLETIAMLDDDGASLLERFEDFTIDNADTDKDTMAA